MLWVFVSSLISTEVLVRFQELTQKIKEERLKTITLTDISHNHTSPRPKEKTMCISTSYQIMDEVKPQIAQTLQTYQSIKRTSSCCL